MNFKKPINRFRRNVKAVSPVIATIILVAISIVMAISVAYWALGIGNSFTKFEKVQYVDAYSTVTTDGWTVIADVKNTGTAAATISNVFINGQPASSYTVGTPTITPPLTNGVIITLAPGAAGAISLDIPRGTATWASGMSIQLDIMTAAGNSYPTTVNIP